MELLRELWARTLFGAPTLIFAVACVVAAALYAMFVGFRALASRHRSGRAWLRRLNDVMRRLRLIDNA